MIGELNVNILSAEQQEIINELLNIIRDYEKPENVLDDILENKYKNPIYEYLINIGEEVYTVITVMYIGRGGLPEGKSIETHFADCLKEFKATFDSESKAAIQITGKAKVKLLEYFEEGLKKVA